VGAPHLPAQPDDHPDRHRRLRPPGPCAHGPGKILDAHALLGLDRFFGQVDRGGLPRELVEESVTRYATEIAPAAVRAAV
jgi:hypothetical protein